MAVRQDFLTKVKGVVSLSESLSTTCLNMPKWWIFQWLVPVGQRTVNFSLLAFGQNSPQIFWLLKSRHVDYICSIIYGFEETLLQSSRLQIASPPLSLSLLFIPQTCSVDILLSSKLDFLFPYLTHILDFLYTLF